MGSFSALAAGNATVLATSQFQVLLAEQITFELIGDYEVGARVE
jgi:hypothetical protein